MTARRRAAEIPEEVAQLIARARAGRAWLYRTTTFCDVWMSPAELKTAVRGGQQVNAGQWRLRNPWNEVMALNERIKQLTEERDALVRRMGNG